MKKNNNWINKKWSDQIQFHINELNKSYDEYKNKFNPLEYYLVKFIALPLSVLCLFIPFYWSWKKYKLLDNDRKKLLNNINDNKNNKLIIHKNIFDSINFLNIFDEFTKIINYYNFGPIPYKLIEELKANSLFDLSKYEFANTYNSSWGIIGNTIVIHSANQNHISYWKTYSNSITISYYDANSEQEETTTVYASIEKIAYEINHELHNYMYMINCENLEFDYIKKSGKISSWWHNKKNKYTELENKKFDQEYNWFRNDETQFRMIFTPYTQEQFLLNAKEDNIKPYYKWHKKNNFIYNEYLSSIDIGSITNSFNNYNFNFLSNPKINDDDLKKEIYDFIVNYYYNIYLAFNFYWLTTILKSEDQLSIIKNVINHKMIEQDYNYYFHYILKEILNIKALYFNDIDTIHNIVANDIVYVNNYELYLVEFKGISYKIIPKIEYVCEYSYEANRNVKVPVQYDDYILQTKNIKILCQIYNNCNYYWYHLGDKLFTNINDQNVLNAFNNLKIKIVLKNKIFACENIDLNNNNLITIINFLNVVF